MYQYQINVLELLLAQKNIAMLRNSLRFSSQAETETTKFDIFGRFEIQTTISIKYGKFDHADYYSTKATIKLSLIKKNSVGLLYECFATDTFTDSKQIDKMFDSTVQHFWNSCLPYFERDIV